MAFGSAGTDRSTRTSSIVIAAPIVAQIAILLVGGVLADRTSRKRMLVLADSIAMCAQAAIAFLFLSGLATVPTLTALMLVNGVAMALGTPAAMGFIPQIVDRADLQAANALLGVARNSAFMLGAALAGVLVATVGAGWTLAIDGVSFGFSALLIASLRPRQQEATEAATLMEDLRLGWREFISHQWLWTIVLQFSVIVAAMEAVFGLIGPAVTKLQMGGSVDWGIISAGLDWAPWSAASLPCGSTFTARCCSRRCARCFSAWCRSACRVPLSVWLIATLAFVEGIAGQMFAVLWYTTLQKMIAPHLLSRVSAYDHLGSVALAPLGIVAGGFLFEMIGARNTLLLASATIFVPTLCVLGVREVRQLTTSEVNQRTQ